MCDQAAGNYRILMTLAGERLPVAARNDLAVPDDNLYRDVFAQPDTKAQQHGDAINAHHSTIEIRYKNHCEPECVDDGFMLGANGAMA